jgi:hypothetical protein
MTGADRRNLLALECVENDLHPVLSRSAHAEQPEDEPDRHDDDHAGEQIISHLAQGVETECPDAVDDAQKALENIYRLDVEPHQQGADNQRQEK